MWPFEPRGRRDRETISHSEEADADRRSREPGWSDFLNVVNRRRELFPEEFPEGPYGAPPIESEDELH